MDTTTTNQEGTTVLNPYTAKKEARIERFEELARKNDAKAEQLMEKAEGMADVIPLGQPIHGVKDRNYRDRIQGTYDRAFETQEKADYYKQKAKSAQHNLEHTISSDDPDAIRKLEEKIEVEEKFHDAMARVNKIIRDKALLDEEKVTKIVEAGIEEATALQLLKPNVMGDKGYPSYAIQNHSAEIRRLKDRLQRLKQTRDAPCASFEYNGVRVVENAEANRVQLFYPTKPDEATRQNLKSNGFRWNHTDGCWQRMRGTSATYSVRRVLGITCGTCAHFKPTHHIYGDCANGDKQSVHMADMAACDHHPALKEAAQ